MVDEFKSIRDNLFKALTGLTGSPTGDDDDDGEDEAARMDARTARALLQALFARAGKGKDEFVQIIAREIGMAVAAMLKEPLSQLAKHQKLQISFEFVPKSPQADDGSAAGAAGSEAETEEEDGEDLSPTRSRSRRGETTRGARRRSRDD